MTKAVAKKDSKAELHSGHRSRLRDRFLQNGVNALQDYEILEMILFAASPRSDMKTFAKKLIKEMGSLAAVLRATPEQMKKVEGVSDAVISSIKICEAACQIMIKEDVKSGPVIQSWTSLLDYCRMMLGHKTEEEFHLLFLNHKNVLIADEMQNKGTVDHTPVYPREVVKRALELGASAVIMVHNHPSGDVQPSKADIDMTRQVINAGHSVGIRVHDHLIVGAKQTFSFKSNGLI
jgi:DNA repair protein RadC